MHPWQLVLQATVDMRVEANQRIVEGMRRSNTALFADGLSLMEAGKRISRSLTAERTHGDMNWIPGFVPDPVRAPVLARRACDCGYC